MFAELETDEAGDDADSAEETIGTGFTDMFANLETDDADNVGKSAGTGFTGMFAELDEATAIDDARNLEDVESGDDISDFLSELTLDEPETAVPDSKLAALADASEPDEDYHTGYTQLFDQLSVESFPEDDSIIETDAESDESIPDWLSEISDSDLEAASEDASPTDAPKRALLQTIG